MVVLGEKPGRVDGAVEGMLGENGEVRRLAAGDDFESGCVKLGVRNCLPTLAGVRSGFGFAPGAALESLKDFHTSCCGGSINPRRPVPGKGEGEVNGVARFAALLLFESRLLFS